MKPLLINFKNCNLKKVAILFFLIILFLKTSAQEVNQLGNVVYSVLTPDLFREQNGKGWFLLDGGIDLKTNGFTSDRTDLCLITGAFCNSIPDARGVFIRGMNLDQTASLGDEDGNRVVGKFQDFQITSHSHKFYLGTRVAGHDYKTQGGEFWGEERTTKDTEDFPKGGGDETRPRNITLYTYIKLNID